MKRSSKAPSEALQKQSTLPIQILGVCLIALALLMAVSLLSHSPEDPPNSSRPPELAQNFAGWIGAHVSYYLLFSVGYGAYALTALMLFWGWNRFQVLSVKPLVIRSATLFALMVLYCGATGVPSRGRTYLAWQLGGWLGVTLSSSLLVPYLGRIGSYIFLATSLVVLLMVATEIPFSRIPEWVSQALQRVFAFAHDGGRGFLHLCRDWAAGMGVAFRKWQGVRAKKKAARLAEKQATEARKAALVAEEEAWDDLRYFLRDSGAVIPGGDAWVLSGDPSLTASLRMKASRKIPISVAGVDSRFLRYNLRPPRR